MNASTNSPEMFVVDRARLEDGSYRKPVPPLIQDGRSGNHLGFDFV
jgi:hypothetical protein